MNIARKWRNPELDDTMHSFMPAIFFHEIWKNQVKIFCGEKNLEMIGKL